jgi:hypothetical protein
MKSQAPVNCTNGVLLFGNRVPLLPLTGLFVVSTLTGALSFDIARANRPTLASNLCNGGVAFLSEAQCCTGTF